MINNTAGIVVMPTLRFERLDDNTWRIVNADSSATRGLSLSALYAGSYVFITPNTSAFDSEGCLYYDSTAHKLKIRTGAGFETVTSA